MDSIFKKIKTPLFVFLVLLFLVVPLFVFTAEEKSDKYGASKVYKKTLLTQIGIGDKSPMEIAQSMVRVILGFVGIVLFGLILYAGFIWIKARDNQNEVEKAKNIIENCLYGVIIIVLAYGISEFIFSRLIGG